MKLSLIIFNQFSLLEMKQLSIVLLGTSLVPHVPLGIYLITFPLLSHRCAEHTAISVLRYSLTCNRDDLDSTQPQVTLRIASPGLRGRSI